MPTRFETFSVPAAYMATHTVLFVSVRTTGSVMETGDGVSHVVPIYEGFALHHAILRLAGRDPAVYSMNLTERGYSLTAADREFARNVKEKLCCIASGYDTVLTENDKEKTYELSVVNTITVGAERVRFTETIKEPAESTASLSR